MSYTPTEWQTGDKITAEKLNNLEGGVEASCNMQFVVTMSQDANSRLVLDKSAEEIYNAIEHGMQIKINSTVTGLKSFVATVEDMYAEDGHYTVQLSHIVRGDGKPRYYSVFVTDDSMSFSNTDLDTTIKLVFFNPGAPGSNKYTSSIHKSNLSSLVNGTVIGVESGSSSCQKAYLFDGNSFYRFTYTPQANKLNGTFFTFSEQSQTELTKTEKTISFDASE